jgi:hypothetical protein
MQRNGLKTHLSPPRLSTFKRRGGGSRIWGASFRRLRLKSPDQRFTGGLDFHCLSSFNPVGPFHVVSPFAPFPSLPPIPHLAMWQGPFPLASPRSVQVVLSPISSSTHRPSLLVPCRVSPPPQHLPPCTFTPALPVVSTCVLSISSDIPHPLSRLPPPFSP